MNKKKKKPVKNFEAINKRIEPEILGGDLFPGDPGGRGGLDALQAASGSGPGDPGGRGGLDALQAAGGSGPGIRAILKFKTFPQWG